MYTYKVKELIKIYDGDTITVRIDLGFDTERTESLRLARIDTPEIRGVERPEGLLSRAWLVEKLTSVNVEDIIIKTQQDKTGKYGRYIVDVYIGDMCLNDELVLEGYAVYKDY